MTPARACFALASFLALAFAAAAGCGSSNGNASGGSGSGASGSGGTTGTGGEDPTSVMCHSCLDTMCATQKAACTGECYAIQACLDALCSSLSASGSSDEGKCQVYCQGLHPTGKQQHLDYVNCAAAGPCTPPCAGAPYDLDQCTAVQLAGTCKAAADSCNGSQDCVTYKACIGACSTFADCQNCAMGTSGQNGLMLDEAVTLCVAQTCLAEEWVPNI
jgi:hypothetical protein